MNLIALRRQAAQLRCQMWKSAHFCAEGHNIAAYSKTGYDSSPTPIARRSLAGHCSRAEIEPDQSDLMMVAPRRSSFIYNMVAEATFGNVSEAMMLTKARRHFAAPTTPRHAPRSSTHPSGANAFHKWLRGKQSMHGF